MDAMRLIEQPARTPLHARSRRTEERAPSSLASPLARLPALPGRLGGMPDHPTARAMSHAAVLQMQRTVGNHAVQRLLRSQDQPKAGGSTIQRCGAMPCNCSEEERVKHALKHLPETAANPATQGMPVARQTTSAPLFADPKRAPVFLRRVGSSRPSAELAIERESIQRGWFDGEEEEGAEESGSIKDWLGKAGDWVGEQFGGAGDGLTEHGGGTGAGANLSANPEQLDADPGVAHCLGDPKCKQTLRECATQGVPRGILGALAGAAGGALSGGPLGALVSGVLGGISGLYGTCFMTFYDEYRDELFGGGPLQTAEAGGLGAAAGVIETAAKTLPGGQKHTCTTVLVQGCSGIQVTIAQQRLNEAGASPPLAVDGQFGPRTRAAVMQFQLQQGLTPDGIIGPQTRAALGM